MFRHFFHIRLKSLLPTRRHQTNSRLTWSWLAPLTEICPIGSVCSVWKWNTSWGLTEVFIHSHSLWIIHLGLRNSSTYSLTATYMTVDLINIWISYILPVQHHHEWHHRHVDSCNALQCQMVSCRNRSDWVRTGQNVMDLFLGKNWRKSVSTNLLTEEVIRSVAASIRWSHLIGYMVTSSPPM